MTTTSDQRVGIRILDQEFTVACPPEARQELEQAAAHLNGRMREIKRSGKLVGLDRVAIMAALNLSHELLAERRERSALEAALRQLEQRIEAALPAASDVNRPESPEKGT